jgi:hypothetical protein
VSQFEVGARSFLLSTSSIPVLGVSEPGALSAKEKRPGHEADHSPPSIAEVENSWNYTTLPLTSSWRSV